ncbi:pyridoxal phosphate-dependent transferase [Rhizophagus diaphanus]|nr:pyridoxal phosphate-dependent transferase [Rhizophagus diaphanus] [Rhizophagus sp. MUCL 43196]
MALDSLECKPDLKNFNSEKTAFLKEFNAQYGYGGKIDQIREEEYPQLKGAVFLDHAATTTYAKSVLLSFTTDLINNLYGNPHANSPSSQLCNQRLDKVRDRVLRHFNANPGDYQVIFTQNATAAIKLVGEMFPWTSDQSSYKYLRESHNSLIGLRRFAEEADAKLIKAITEDDFICLFDNDPKTESIQCDNHYSTNALPRVGLIDSPHGTQQEFQNTNQQETSIQNNIIYNLFAYPAQCNFSGIRFPLNWIQKIKRFNKNNNSKILVLLDAAAYVSSSLLSLSEVDTSPDFVTISFYKMFGFPTGLGALIVKNELEPILRKRYFGGGTLDSIVYDRPWQKFRKSLHERYEDGTVNFLDIIALDHAFDTSERLYNNFDLIKNHVTSLIIYLSRSMKSLRHYNGQPVCYIYSNRDFSNSTLQGPVFSFNAKRADGSWVGYLELERLASVNNIHIRTGRLCNPGSSARWTKLDSEDIIDSFYNGKTCHDDQDMWNGKPAGTIRISVGAMTTIDDILIWMDFFKKYYVEIAPSSVMNNSISFSQNLVLEKVTLFPIKSCHGFSISPSTSWPITSKGLMYDREWMLVDAGNGRALSQKRFPRMTLICPEIIKDKGLLAVLAPDKEPLYIDLNIYPNTIEFSKCSSQVCGDKIQTCVYTSSEINEWFSSFLNVSCRLARHASMKDDSLLQYRFIKSYFNVPDNMHLSLSNESPFLIISHSSVNYINKKITEGGNKEVESDCFRGNFLIKGTKEFEEDQWKFVKFDEQVFKIIGPCRRCNMTCINHKTAEVAKEPYSTLALCRQFNGKIYFGQHMIHVPELSEKPYLIKSNSLVQIVTDRDLNRKLKKWTIWNWLWIIIKYN